MVFRIFRLKVAIYQLVIKGMVRERNGGAESHIGIVLYRRKAGINADIEAIHDEFTGTGSAVPQTIVVPSAGKGRGGQRTPAERKIVKGARNLGC